MSATPEQVNHYRQVAEEAQRGQETGDVADCNCALGSSYGCPEHAPIHYVCKKCGAASPVGIGYWSATPGPIVTDADCPNDHLIATLPASWERPTSRFRNRVSAIVSWALLCPTCDTDPCECAR